MLLLVVRTASKEGKIFCLGSGDGLFHGRSDVYSMSDQEILLEMQRALGRIEGTLSTLVDLPNRVRALEGWRKWILGIQAAVGAVIIVAFRILK